MAFYPIKLIKKGKAQKISKYESIQVFTVVTETPPGETKARSRLVMTRTANVIQRMSADDKSTSEDERETAGLAQLPDDLVGKSVKLRVAAAGGAYSASVTLPSIPAGTVLTAKNCLRLEWEDLSTQQRDEFFYGLVSREYPHLAGLVTNLAIEPGLWAEASMLMALLELSEQLKGRFADPSLPAVTTAKKSITDLAGAVGFGDVNAKFEYQAGGDKAAFWEMFVDPALHLFACMRDGKTAATGKWALLRRCYPSFALNRTNFAKIVNDYTADMRALVLKEAQRIYKDFFAKTKNLTGDDADFGTLPDATMVVIGDGSGTKGVLGAPSEAIALMAYQANASRPHILGGRQHPRFGKAEQGVTQTLDNWEPATRKTDEAAGKEAGNENVRHIDQKGKIVDMPDVSLARIKFKAVGKGRRTALHFGASGFDETLGRYDVKITCGPQVNGKPRFTLWFASNASTTAAAEVTFCRLFEEVKDAKAPTERRPVAVGPSRTCGGFIFDSVRRELSFPTGVFKDEKEFTVTVSSESGEELFYALCISPSAVQVNLQDIYAWSDFIPKSETEMTAAMKTQIKEVKETLSMYTDWGVKLTGGGVGKFRDAKTMSQVVAGGKEIAGYDWKGAKKEEADKLRCSYVDFHEDGSKLELRVYSFTDPTNIGSDGPAKGFKSNKDLSLLRCWALVGLVCKEFVKDGRHADAVKLFDAAGPSSDPFRTTYLKRVADGAFDYDAAKKAAG